MRKTRVPHTSSASLAASKHAFQNRPSNQNLATSCLDKLTSGGSCLSRWLSLSIHAFKVFRQTRPAVTPAATPTKPPWRNATPSKGGFLDTSIEVLALRKGPPTTQTRALSPKTVWGKSDSPAWFILFHFVRYILFNHLSKWFLQSDSTSCFSVVKNPWEMVQTCRILIKLMNNNEWWESDKVKCLQLSSCLYQSRAFR